jgi:hypothetical protein
MKAPSLAVDVNLWNAATGTLLPASEGHGERINALAFGRHPRGAASAMRQRRETVEHPFGTLKMRMGATHFLMKRLPKVATEMALHVLAYNLTCVINIVGIQPLMAAIRA